MLDGGPVLGADPARGVIALDGVNMPVDAGGVRPPHTPAAVRAAFSLRLTGPLNSISSSNVCMVESTCCIVATISATPCLGCCPTLLLREHHTLGVPSERVSRGSFGCFSTLPSPPRTLHHDRCAILPTRRLPR